jgi:uncharacterized spore protein YtfJ
MTVQPHPDLAATTRAASDIFSVQRVFGPAYERDGTLVVPVAKLVGSHGVAGAHADARAGIRRGDPDAHGPGEHAPGEHAPGDPVSGTAPAAGAGTATPEASGPGGSWHRGAARGPGARGPQWPFGSGRPTGRSGAHADSGGYAGRVKPLGVYVLSADGVRWQPALDLNRVILGGQAFGTVAVLALSWALRRRR